MDQEQQAVFRLKEGDIEGLEFLVRAYYFSAVRAAFLILRDRAQAEDIVQSTFLKLEEKIHQYDSNRPFKAWFMRCVVNASLNSARKNNRLVSLEGLGETQALEAVRGFVSQQMGPTASVEAQELRDLVWQALEKLTPNQRAAIVMRYYLGFNQAEMVEQMDSPASSIKWWLYSARKRLRELLAPTQTLHHIPGDLPRSERFKDADQEQDYG
jgi:RNA polymerase sigma-70 factor (ECF subfamily)